MNPQPILLACAIAPALLASCYLNAGPLDHWQWRNPLPQGNAIHGMSYGNGLFVAVGDRDTILTSPDGMTWMRCSAGTRGLFEQALGRKVTPFRSAPVGNASAIPPGARLDTGTIMGQEALVPHPRQCNL